jgi:hypothetical protein
MVQTLVIKTIVNSKPVQRGKMKTEDITVELDNTHKTYHLA